MVDKTLDEILKIAAESGMIDLATITSQVEEMENQKYLKMHTQKVWQGTDGGWYTYLPPKTAEGKRRLIRKSKETDLTKAIIDHYKSQVEEPTFDAVFHEWSDKKLEFGEIKKQTYDRYKTDYVRFFKDSEIRNTRFSKITEDDIEVFIKSSIHDMHLTSKGWGNLRIIINGVFHYAKRHKLTTISIDNLIEEIDLSPKAFKKKVILDETQVFNRTEEIKINRFVEERQTLIGLGCLLQFQTGLRCGELAALQWSDVHGEILYVTKTEERFKDENGHYVWNVRESTKGRDGGRKVVLTERAQEILKEIRKLNPFGEYIFMKDGKRVKGQAFTRRLETICRNCNMLERSSHKARKTYATNLIDAGVPEKLIIKQIGHTTIQTTKDYYYFDNHEINEVKEILQSV